MHRESFFNFIKKSINYPRELTQEIISHVTPQNILDYIDMFMRESGDNMFDSVENRAKILADLLYSLNVSEAEIVKKVVKANKDLSYLYEHVIPQPLICYNMVPSEFGSIDKMTDHLINVADMNFTSVWVNPIQEASGQGAERTDKQTGQTFDFVHSAYAMRYHDRIDSRISTVKRAEDGSALFTEEQKNELTVKFLDPIFEQALIDSQIKKITAFHTNKADELEMAINKYSMRLDELIKKESKLERELESDIKHEIAAEIKTLNPERIGFFDRIAFDVAYPEDGEIIVTINQNGYDYKDDKNNLIEITSKIHNSKFHDDIRALKKRLEEEMAKLNIELSEVNTQLEEGLQKITNQQIELISFLDDKAIKKFTDTAKKYGIRPIFDLVLNHVAKDSPLVVLYPGWFKASAAFKDAMAFSYYNKPLHDMRADFSLVLYPEDKKIISIKDNQIILKQVNDNKINCYFLEYDKISKDNQQVCCKEIVVDELLSYFVGVPYDVNLITDNDDINSISQKSIYLQKDANQNIRAWFRDLGGEIKSIQLKPNQNLDNLVFPNEYKLQAIQENLDTLKSQLRNKQYKLADNTICLLSPDANSYQVTVCLVRNDTIVKQQVFNYGHTHENKPNVWSIKSGSSLLEEVTNNNLDAATLKLLRDIKTSICGITANTTHKVIKKFSNIQDDLNLSKELKLQFKGGVPVSLDDICTFPKSQNNKPMDITKNKKAYRELLNFVVSSCLPQPVYVLHDDINKMMLFWKNYIDKYIDGYGFEGVRVDAVKKLPQRVRRELYDYIKEKTQNPQTIICEELLFIDDRPLAEVIQEVGSSGGKYVTGSAFYKRRGRYGELPDDILAEQGLKNGIVSYGTINFTGNHDHTPAANEVLIEMAEEAMYGSAATSIKSICEVIGKLEKKKEQSKLTKNERTESARIMKLNGKINYYKIIARYQFMQNIKQEMQQDPDGKKVEEFLIRLKDKIALNMFAGSGGYYFLCGDEVANMVPTEIYLRTGNGEVYPRKCHKLLVDQSESFINMFVTTCIKELACDRLKKHQMLANIYNETEDPDEKRLLLAPFVDFITNAINGRDKAVQQEFKRLMNYYTPPDMLDEIKELLTFSEDNFIPQPRFPERPTKPTSKFDEKCNLASFIKENNTILTRLPIPEQGAWAHSFKLAPHVIVTIKINNMGFTPPANIIVTNLDPNEAFTFDIKTMKTLANWLQQRCFFGQEADMAPNSQWSQCWQLIMGDDSDDKRVARPIIYANAGVIVEDDVRKDEKKSFISKEAVNKESKFSFVGKPKNVYEEKIDKKYKYSGGIFFNNQDEGQAKNPDPNVSNTDDAKLSK